jgi:hypothetical protein
MEQAPKAARLTKADAAARIGLSKPEYQDLESYDDETEICLSLRQVRKVGRVPGADPVWLLTGAPAPPLRPLSLREVVEAIRDYLGRHRMTPAACEELVGWGVSDALDDWQVAWDWNVDGLRDICGLLGLDYRAVLLPGKNDATT